MLDKTINVDNPRFLFQARTWGTRSSRHGPYRLGYPCVTMGVTKSDKAATRSQSRKRPLSANRRLQLALLEVGIVSNRGSARHGEWFGALYTPPVTSGE